MIISYEEMWKTDDGGMDDQKYCMKSSIWVDTENAGNFLLRHQVVERTKLHIAVVMSHILTSTLTHWDIKLISFVILVVLHIIKLERSNARILLSGRNRYGYRTSLDELFHKNSYCYCWSCSLMICGRYLL